MIEAAGYKGQPAIVGGAFIAGFFASACSLPFDYVKTQIQKMKAGPDGKFPYTGPVDCALKTLASKGPLAFYTGFPTYCVRIAPHAVITLLFMAALPKWEASVGL
jgi:solute carrier family 25 oxoglutarate transporter 11